LCDKGKKEGGDAPVFLLRPDFRMQRRRGRKDIHLTSLPLSTIRKEKGVRFSYSSIMHTGGREEEKGGKGGGEKRDPFPISFLNLALTYHLSKGRKEKGREGNTRTRLSI